MGDDVEVSVEKRPIGEISLSNKKVAERSFSISKLLIEVGADPMVKNKFGETPLDFADSDKMRDLLLGN